ncbi:TatD family hydrolase [Ectothiorhodospiraceae bacterium WFHF3C12]|nr:TatD family hydrolase [Ectothiorhodospiraceae bacterium WFHF3C12]
MNLADSHCHFHLLEDGPGNIESVLRDAADNGVAHFLNVAVDVERHELLLELTRRWPAIAISAGVHPSGTGEDPDVDGLAALCSGEAVVAVGETGLDYVYNSGDLGWQRERFRRHVRAARAVGKPVIVHTRGAPEDTVTILREERAHEVGGVIHCFTEDWDTAQACMDLGFHISLSGIVTFRSAESLREVARHIPRDRLLVETDAPYLAPVPHRGEENRPALLRHTVECIARARDEPPERVADATRENYFQLFPLTRA